MAGMRTARPGLRTGRIGGQFGEVTAQFDDAVIILPPDGEEHVVEFWHSRLLQGVSEAGDGRDAERTASRFQTLTLTPRSRAGRLLIKRHQRKVKRGRKMAATCFFDAFLKFGVNSFYL